jgi:hypothetical protein
MISPEHADALARAAISPELAEARGIRSVFAVSELPEWARDRPWAADAVPSLVFPWLSRDGRQVEQLRPDRPLDFGGDLHKYLWPTGETSILNEVIAAGEDTKTVLIVEGTKQCLAAGSWAPGGVAVYGIGGCRNWSSDGLPIEDLAVVDGHAVVICLDADVATNPDVWSAAESLGKAVRLEGATAVRYADTGAKGTNGLDDVLGAKATDRRREFLARMIDQASTKLPPKSGLTKKQTGPERVKVIDASTADRPQIFVDGDRLDVINQLTTALLLRWNESKMFDHGGVLSLLSTTNNRGQDDVPCMLALDKKTFTDLVQETAVTVRRSGRDGDEIAYCYPEGQTMDALLSRHKRFAPLHRIARVPFVRADGSVCQANGYDPASRTLLVADETVSGLAIPDDPTAEDLASAVKLIREEWLVDFFAEMPSDADRANTVGLALTPFIRGLVDVVPLAVVDGIGMGVGKNLLADVALAIPATGSPLEPLNWSQEDEENRKQITSAFIDGADVFVFDEAHHLHGAALARALTSAFWKDRKLGYNQMLGFPNMVTWVSLGNNVRVEGDITRRVYRIALRPNHPNPQDRSERDFRQPRIREWTRRNRGEVVSALLTLVRSWYAAGRPVAASASFGSFEAWERVVGGILAHAGFEGFLGNTKEWREQTSFESHYWAQHVAWLLSTFGSEVVFTCAQVREKAASDPESELPAGLTDLAESPRDYNRRLGQAYARNNEKYFGGVRLVRAEGKQHNNVDGWMVVDRPATPEGDGGSDDGPPEPDDRMLSTSSPMSGSNPMRTDVPSVPENEGVTGGIGGDRGERYSSSNAREKNNVGAGEHAFFPAYEEGPRFPPVPPVPPQGEFSQVNGIEGSAGVTTLAPPATPDSGTSVTIALADSGASVTSGLFDLPTPLKVYERATVLDYAAPGAISLPEGVLALDIETASQEEMWSRGPEFVRLVGYQKGDRISVSPDPWELVGEIAKARLVIGHNVMAFDLVAYAKEYGIDLRAMVDAGQVLDTKLTAILNNPPTPGMKQGQIEKAYSLDALGASILGQTKTGDLKALAAEFGGYDAIPVDDIRYVRYLVGDVDLTARLAGSLRTSPYIRREHRVAAIAAQMRMNGFKINSPEVDRRVEVNRAERARRLAELAERYGLPTTKKDGKPSKSPHATAEGKAAIARAFADLGVDLPPTPSGEPGFGKVALEQVAEEFAGNAEVMALVELVGGLNGVRTVYETLAQYTINGRVHPEVGMFQASGRWSTTKPGLTVLGKRGGKYREREVLLADEGHVIISADLSQVDARALAALSQDPAYIAMFAPGLDLHKEIARRIWGDESRREDAKALGHGWNYGLGINGMMRNAKVDEETARRFDRGMREQFPRLVEWRESVRAAGESGEMLDNGFGRMLRVDPARAFTQSPALMGQACARDLATTGLLRLPHEVLPMLRAFVHDEVVMSVPIADVEEVERVVLDALSFDWAPPGAALSIRIEAGLGERRGHNWGDVYAK